MSLPLTLPPGPGSIPDPYATQAIRNDFIKRTRTPTLAQRFAFGFVRWVGVTRCESIGKRLLRLTRTLTQTRTQAQTLTPALTPSLTLALALP